MSRGRREAEHILVTDLSAYSWKNEEKRGFCCTYAI